jgi:hypothetical protein
MLWDAGIYWLWIEQKHVWVSVGDDLSKTCKNSLKRFLSNLVRRKERGIGERLKMSDVMGCEKSQASLESAGAVLIKTTKN